jgi:muramoyltetrapeptide carboxypeptidase
MTLIKPPSLRKGDTIGIIAPSSYVESDKLDAGVEILREYGFAVSVHPQALARDHQSAGSPVEKVVALHEVFSSSEIKAIMAAGGGNRSTLILDRIDYSLLKAHPKLFMGFSDSTALLSALASKAGLASCYGPTVKTLPRLDRDSLDFTFGLLAGKASEYPMNSAVPLLHGKGEGPLFGGTLSLLCTLGGTGYLPDLTGAILYIEDIGEEISRVDRMIWHLRQSIPFHKLAGLMFGEFILSEETGRPFGFTLDEIIQEHTRHLDIPVVMNAPFGHGSVFYPLPFGNEAVLQATPDGVSLHLKDPLVAT